jgi:hypothetical protein
MSSPAYNAGRIHPSIIRASEEGADSINYLDAQSQGGKT